MGYGLGVFLLALGLILVFAVQDAIEAVDLRMVGWILAAAGVLVIAITAMQMNTQASPHDGGHDHGRPGPAGQHGAPDGDRPPGAAGCLRLASRRCPGPQRVWGRGTAVASLHWLPTPVGHAV